MGKFSNITEWFFSRSTRQSKKHGTLIIERVWGAWRVYSHGNENTGPELTAVWLSIFKLVKKNISIPVTNVLMLGLGAGGTIKEIREQFPNSIVTAVEYDEEMIGLAHTLQLWAPYETPHIIAINAADYINTTEEKYDIICVDLFENGKPATLILEESFLRALMSRLRKHGVLAINVYKNQEYLNVLKHIFSNTQTLHIAPNIVGLLYI